MKHFPFAIVLLACSCSTSASEPYESCYFLKLEHRFPPFVAKELEAEFPNLSFIADGRTPYVYAFTRDESAMSSKLRAKLEARKDELDRE